MTTSDEFLEARLLIEEWEAITEDQSLLDAAEFMVRAYDELRAEIERQHDKLYMAESHLKARTEAEYDLRIEVAELRAENERLLVENAQIRQLSGQQRASIERLSEQVHG